MTPRLTKLSTRRTQETTLALRDFSKATNLWVIYVEYSSGGKRTRWPTGYKVPVTYWNPTKQAIRPQGVEDVGLANAEIYAIKGQLDNLIQRIIRETGHKPTVEHLQSAYREHTAAAEHTPEATSIELVPALSTYIEQRKAELKRGSQTMYFSLKTNLEAWQTKRGAPLLLDQLTLADTEAFQEWLLADRGMVNTTVERRVIALKKFLGTQPLGFDYKKIKLRHRVKTLLNYADITLTPQELEQLRLLELQANPRLDRVRDLFLLGCWTGLRHSDLIRLDKEHIRTTGKGGKSCIRIDIQKTDTLSNIPLFDVAAAILRKYETPTGTYELPRISNQKFNAYLKELCQLLPSLHEPIRKIAFQGKSKKEDRQPRFRFVASHTARRTFATLCIQLGISQHFVMSWTGHVDVRSFRRYQNALQGADEAADSLERAFSLKVTAM